MRLSVQSGNCEFQIWVGYHSIPSWALHGIYSKFEDDAFWARMAAGLLCEGSASFVISLFLDSTIARKELKQRGYVFSPLLRGTYDDLQTSDFSLWLCKKRPPGDSILPQL